MHDRVASPRACQRAGWTRRWHCMGNRRRRGVRRRSHAASTLCTQISGNDKEETCQNRTAEDQKALHGSPGCPANGPPTSLPNDSLHTKMRRVRPRFQVSLPAFLLLDAPAPHTSAIRFPHPLPLCYNRPRRGTCRKATAGFSAVSAGFRGVFPDRRLAGLRRGFASRRRCLPVLPGLLAEIRVAPLQTHLSRLRLLHVLRGLLLTGPVASRLCVKPQFL